MGKIHKFWLIQWWGRTCKVLQKCEGFCSFWKAGCHPKERRTANENVSSGSASMSHFILPNFCSFWAQFLITQFSKTWGSTSPYSQPSL